MTTVELLEQELADFFDVPPTSELDVRDETPEKLAGMREIRTDLTVLAMNKPKTK